MTRPLVPAGVDRDPQPRPDDSRVARATHPTPIPRALLTALLASLTLLVTSSGFAAERPDRARASAKAPSPDELRACMTNAMRDACLDGLFRRYLATHTTSDALRLISDYEAAYTDMRVHCHPLVHAVGRETFRLRGTIHEAFAACDGTCHSGCYHGAVERFLGGSVGGHVSQADLERKANAVCSAPAPKYVRFQCLHGLGHALLYFSGYQLDTALGVCESFGDRFSQHACYGGVFMENITAAAFSRRDVSRTDYHYPCSRLDPKYRSDCYLMQTTRMGEMGLWTAGFFVECAKAGRFRNECMMSIGRDLSNDVREGDTEWAAGQCEWRPAGDRRACIRGAIYAVIDNSWDLRYALPFCAALHTGEDRAYCLRISARYVADNRDAPAEAIERDCRRYFPEGRLCRAVAEDASRFAARVREASPPLTSSK